MEVCIRLTFGFSTRLTWITQTDEDVGMLLSFLDVLLSLEVGGISAVGKGASLSAATLTLADDPDDDNEDDGAYVPSLGSDCITCVRSSSARLPS